MMEIFILGVGHHRTPVAIREKLVGSGLDGEALYRLYTGKILSEALLLKTCNRLEVIGVATDPLNAKQALSSLLATGANLKPEELEPYFHFHLNNEAVSYLFRVASGLDSQVLGEPQILGQVKEAFRQALVFRTVGPVVSKLFHKSFQTAKKVRTETGVSAGAVSVASAAVDYATRSLGNFSSLKVAIVGAGEMAGLAAAHLKARGTEKLVIISRTLDRARELAQRFGATAGLMDTLPQVLSEADLLISAAGGDEPVLTSEHTPVLVSRSGRPFLIMDLGVPRNVSESLGKIAGINLKNIDEFTAVVEQNQKIRHQEAQKAEIIIAAETRKFSLWLSSLATRPTLVALTERAEAARKTELERTFLHHNFSPEQIKAIETMSKALVRRILHHPLTFAKTCHKHGRTDFKLDHIRRIFGLDE